MKLQQQQGHNGKIASTAILLLFSLVARAQLLTPDIAPGKYLILASEQYTQGHYSLAAQTAKQYLGKATLHSIHPASAPDIDKAKYLLALASLKTNVPGGADSAVHERNATPDPAYKQRLGFVLAQYYFEHGDLKRAIALYEATGAENLNPDELADEKFEMAYCYFNNKQFDKAEPLLVSIKELTDSKYYMAGNYYYGLLVYNKNKYKEALQSFDRIKEAKEYKAVVPYYIAEIYYFMGNRERALNYADTLIKRADKSYYDKELHLLEAQCLFEEQRYKEALPYFDFYYNHTNKIRKQDLYEIAYCDYRTDEWSAAIEKFKLLSNATDSLGQTAMYLLGDCYLKKGDKPGARNAFGICADMTFNPGQQEASMIMFSRLSYETGYDDDALRQLNALIATFPETHYKDEANTLISDLLVKTNNYKGAMAHLKEVSHKDVGYKQVYQKASYGLAVQQFRNGDLGAAMENFDHSLQHPVNAAYEGAALYWKGEIAYRQHHYDDVLSYEQQFTGRKGNQQAVERISPQATLQHAYLNMGYAAMGQQDYTAAQDFFDHAQEEKGDNYSGMVALVREADAVFMQKNFPKAIVLYDKIIANDTADADYARYQKAILLGLQNKNSEKIALLQSIISRMPPSAYVNHARYELAITWLETDKYKQALNYLHQLTDSVDDKSFAPQALIKTAFIYQQMGNSDLAIDAYKRVVTDYPASEDRLAALEALKSLYIQTNQPAAYTQMLKDNNLPIADDESTDSTYYAAAETQFSSGKWQDAKDGFDNYLQQYPNGIFALKAKYYRAESNYQMKNYSAALEGYKTLLSAGQYNDFFENSARRAATIAYEAKNYTEAYDDYTLLRNAASSDEVKQMAYNGLMKSAYYAGKYSESGAYADTVLGISSTPAETANDALYFKAMSLQQSSQNDSAIVVYKELSANKNGELAAEARYHISEILLKEDKLKDAEAAANETIHLSAGYDLWIVKSYLLLSDILVKENDYFNAKATLQSVVKHTKIADLKQEAETKLDEVNKLEKKHSKLSEEQ